MSTNGDHIKSSIGILERMIAEAPEDPVSITDASPASREIAAVTGIPKRYRGEWHRPPHPLWHSRFEKIMRAISEGGICALIGPRGTGKTRFAAEVMRNYAPRDGGYTTAMELFLRIRASFGKKSGETEADVVAELAKNSLQVIDEVQERGNTPWEDRILTHVFDRRYGAMRPTLVIANLTSEALAECLGDSIISRLNETGGIITIDGPSHREGTGG